MSNNDALTLYFTDQSETIRKIRLIIKYNNINFTIYYET